MWSVMVLVAVAVLGQVLLVLVAVLEVVGDLLELDEDLAAEVLRGGQRVPLGVDGLRVEGGAEDVAEIVGHLVLLLHAAVVLDGEDQRVRRGVEGVGLDGVDQDLLEAQFRGQGPAVEDHRFAVGSVPAID